MTLISRKFGCRSLRLKLILGTIFIELIMLSILIFNTHRNISNSLSTIHQQQIKELELLINESLSSFVLERDLQSLQDFLNNIIVTSNISYMKILDKQNKPMAKAGAQLSQLSAQNLQAFKNQDRYIGQFNLVISSLEVGLAYYELDISYLNSTMKAAQRQSILIASIEILLSIVVLTFFGWIITRSLAQLQSSAERIAQGDFTARVDLKGDQEIIATSNAFNLMAEQLAKIMSQLKDNEYQLKLLHQSSPDFVIGVDNQLTVKFINKAFKNMTSDQILQQPIYHIGPFNDDIVKEKLNFAYNENKTQRFVSFYDHSVDLRIYYDNTVTPLNKNSSSIVLLITSREITEQILYQQRLERLAKYDALTNLPNRILFFEKLQHAMQQTQVKESFLALVYIDLDGFKQINDQYGHDTGDAFLRDLCRNLVKAKRSCDTLARLGGDEFVMILVDLPNKDAVHPLLHGLLSTITIPINSAKTKLSVSASLGINFYPKRREVDSDQLLKEADSAMYQAKLAGKNQYVIFSDD